MRPNLLRNIIDLVFPPHPDIGRVMALSEEEIFGYLSLTYRAEHGTYTGLPYREENIRALIKANKFYKNIRAAQALGAVLGEILLSLHEDEQRAFAGERALIVPVASSKKRRRERGGNQVEWIIEAVPKEMMKVFDYAPHALERAHRESQAQLGRAERQKNARRVFNVRNRAIIVNRHIILVDDVIESGATMKDAMRALREASAREVIGVALAH